MKKIAKETAKTILEQPTKIKVAGQFYNVARPTLGTLILLSEEIVDIPFEEIEKSHSIHDFLKWVQHSQKIAKGLAIMILGAEKIVFGKEETPQTPKTFWQKIKRKEVKQQPKEDVYFLTEKIINQMEVSQIVNTFVDLLGQMQIAHFFLLITFLKDANLLNPTRKVSEMTAFGQLSVDL
ncbi:hypothetical protein ACIRNY_11110 [Capnocytophaga canimorsus]|uniref:hypothetical protein n=1 Tax=Capnocytophaga canimorsus TaxID=28188 RepID=UPI00384E9D30